MDAALYAAGAIGLSLFSMAPGAIIAHTIKRLRTEGITRHKASKETE